MKGEPCVSFRKLGLLLKSQGIVGKHQVALWEIALGLGYSAGLELQEDGLGSELAGGRT